LSGFRVRRTHADDLSAALAAELHPTTRHRHAELAGCASALMTAYRSGDPASSPLLDTGAAALAYAAYRMPATHAAVAAALSAAAPLITCPRPVPADLESRTSPGPGDTAPLISGQRPVPADLDSRTSPGLGNTAPAAAAPPGGQPRTLLDLGGGTGAAVWAAAAVFPTLTEATVLDRSGPALLLGRRLAAHAAAGLPRAATWTRATLTPHTPLPGADLVTMAYVLAELPEPAAAALVTAAAGSAGVVAVVEPGTPAGYRRVLAARERLVGQGMRILAPCPHDSGCPLTGADWCHFAARLDRTPLHRRIKRGARGFEDEKFAYVVAARAPAAFRAGRVVRRPLHRPGVTQLEVCRPEGVVGRTLISRRQGPAYRAAREVRWGGTWPA
jgi:ribosomal protein RSM22 (predicted rRNA methylase)